MMHTSARKVLALAARAPHYFDLSDAEKLVWMIECAYKLGRDTAGKRRCQSFRVRGRDVAQRQKSSR